MRSVQGLVLVVGAGLGLLQGCDKDSGRAPKGAPPPAESAAKPGGCAGGGATIADPASAAVFPRQTGGYCLDPNGEVRVFGEGGKLSMDAICTEAFDGECEVYKGFGLRRVVQVRYVDGAGSPGSVEVYLSKFATREGAYAMFTKRVVGESDPVDSVPRALDAGGASAIGTGRAYVWKGPFLAEIEYANEAETPEQMKASSERLIPSLSKELGSKLPAPADLPPAAALLPSEDRVPLGVLYETKNWLGVEGAGQGAVGFYRAGDKRFRIAAAVRDDPDQAKDLLKTLIRGHGAVEDKSLGDGGYKMTVVDGSGAKLEWWVARSGNRVMGVGDEPFVVHPGMAPAERDKAGLSKDEKAARLRGLLKRGG